MKQNFSTFQQGVRLRRVLLPFLVLFIFANNAFGQSFEQFNSGENEMLAPKYNRAQRHSTNANKFLIEKDVLAADEKIAAVSVNEVDPAINLTLDIYPGTVRATAIQPEGKILVGGNFKTVNQNVYRNIFRLNADYSYDSTFNAATNGTVTAIVMQPNGKILIGGSFTVVNGVIRNRIARINADGSLDTTFDPRAGADSTILDIALQPDGKILIGGVFGTVGSIFRSGVARLNPDGMVDTSFNAAVYIAADTVVYSLALLPNGKIIIGGYLFTQNTELTSVARLNSNGSIDSSFNQPYAVSVYKTAVQADGKILIGGSFTSIGGTARNRIARLNADGTLDAAFDPGTGANANVWSIELQAGDNILIGGFFTSINGAPVRSLARLNNNGSLNSTFNTNSFVSGGVYTAKTLQSAKTLFGGSFVSISPSGTQRDALAIIDSDNSFDPSLSVTTTGKSGARASIVQSDGKIIVSGYFSRINGANRGRIFRLNGDGTLDASFNSGGTGANGEIYAMLLQPDNKIIIAGTFTSFNGTSRNRIARINTDGSLDTAFNAGNTTNGGVYGLAQQPDGKIIAVGNFLVNNSSGFNTGTSSVVRLNSNGSRDDSFPSPIYYTLGAVPFVEGVAVLPDGKIIIGGQFEVRTFNSAGFSTVRYDVMRLSSNGTVDETFFAAVNQFSEVYSVALLPDNKILIGGAVYVGGGTNPTGIARLNANGSLDNSFNAGTIANSSDNIAIVEDIVILSNEKILIGGFFTDLSGTARKNVARLNANGSLDSTFTASADGSVYDISTQPDGRILLSGDFEAVNNVARIGFARLLSETSQRRAPFDFDGDGRTDYAIFRPSESVWYLQNSQNGFSAAQWGTATDKLVPADYDGDGKTDLAIYRGDGQWWIRRSSDGGVRVYSFGLASDIPVPADYTGDGQAELAVYRQGVWYTLNLANNQVQTAEFGLAADKPVPADYDGDGKIDFAVFRDGAWYLLQSQQGFKAFNWGLANDKPVVGDYDGDGKADAAVFRSGEWYLLQSAAGVRQVSWGFGSDQVTPGDYNGDGKADIAVWRPENSVFYVLNLFDNNPVSLYQFGLNGDAAIAASYVR